MESVSIDDLEDWLHAKKANNNAVAKLDGRTFLYQNNNHKKKQNNKIIIKKIAHVPSDNFLGTGQDFP